uniref:Macrophage mannose receptor 1-like n=1 Tax=Kryptolebias marmoratus TaxID=37003 RepID=A0A3Q3BA00_KRYMA
MDKTFFVILLITGFFATFDSFSYYFYSDVVTKAAAAKYCKQHHIDLLQEDVSFNRNKVFAQSTSWFVDYSKAWIGVNKAATMKIWVGSVYPKYYNWSAGEPDGGLTGLCVFMTDLGGWYEHNCSDLKRSVCSNGSHFTIESEMSWTDAKANCEKKKSVLVIIPDETTNKIIRDLLPNGTEAWIGLFKYVTWYSGDVEISQPKWREGQPDNFYGNESCAAMVLEDGTWADEPCDKLYPFICYDVDKSNKRTVKLKIQTTANMEDLVVIASLEEQLGAMLSKQGVTGYRLTWKKLPAKKKDTP